MKALTFLLVFLFSISMVFSQQNTLGYRQDKYQHEVIKERLSNYTFTKFTLPVQREGLNMDFYTCRKKNGDDSYYYTEKFEKEKIVLNFSGGQTIGDIKTLTPVNRHVSSPFLIARDGTIYQLFNSAYWSYHLGARAVGGNANGSRKSISIELSNFGPLKKKDNTLTVYGEPFSQLDDNTLYTKLDKPFKGFTYYASFTDAQYESLIVLLRYLSKAYDIPPTFLSEEDRYKAFSSEQNANEFKGICSHLNFRAQGKWDIGPAFNWDKVIAGVTADSYKRSVPLVFAESEKIKNEVEAEELSELNSFIQANQANIKKVQEEIRQLDLNLASAKNLSRLEELSIINKRFEAKNLMEYYQKRIKVLQRN